MQMSFGSLELEQRISRQSKLMKVNSLIDWEKLRPLFKGIYKRDWSRAGGQEPFDCIMMFKAILLGQWHSLSDEKLEQALVVRIDFLQFCGLSLLNAIPDETTLCRFRNRLVRAELLEVLLGKVNEQLQEHDLMVKQATGAVLDATLITSAARPNKAITLETDAQGQVLIQEDGSQAGVVVEKTSVDPDATWLKKGKKSYFGYRSYVVVDEQDGYVRGVHSAPANESETKHLATAIENAHIQAKRVYGDKGFASAANRGWLRGKKIKSALMHKAAKNKPLTERQKLANRLISKKRYIVEQCFGTAKRLFRMARASYMTTPKVNGQIILKSICMNLTKAVNKILEIHPLRGVIRPVMG